MLDQITDLVKQYGPALGVLIISLYRDWALAEKHKQAVLELENKFLQNQADMDKKYVGKSSTDIITDVINEGGKS